MSLTSDKSDCESDDRGPPCILSESTATEEDRSPQDSQVDIRTGAGSHMKKVMLIVLLAGALKLAFNRVDPDLWGHVQYGQDVLATGELATTTTYTYTTPHYPWINHENFAEIVFGMLTHPVALMLFKCVLAMGVIGLMIRNAHCAQATALSTLVIILLAAMNMAPGWAMRPQIFSYAFFALLIVTLDHCFESTGPDWHASPRRVGEKLWLTVPLFLLWANTHGGFVAGYCVFCLYLACRCAEAWWHGGRAAAGHARLFALVAAVAGLATLINPYGFRLHVWLIHSLGEPRPEISEWAPLTPAEDEFVPAVLLMVLVALSWAFGSRRRSFHQTVLLAVTAWQSVLHLRHVPFFATLVGLWMVPHFQGLMARLQRGRTESEEDFERSPRWGVWVSRGMWATAVILVVALASQLRQIRVDKSVYPVEAFRYMADRDLKGRMVVFFDWAQYAIAAFGDDSTVAFDGRFRTCYPQQVVDMHFDLVLGDVPQQRNRSMYSGIVDGTRALDYGRPDLVLISRELPHAGNVIKEHAGWVLLYQDSLAQLWGRAAKYDDPGSPDYLSPGRRSISDRPQRGYAQWPALPQRASM